jgi:CheY-like chemotaxis protein
LAGEGQVHLSARILIVDDEIEVVRLLANALARHQYQITQALSGAQALAILAREVPDLILLDLAMPGIDGLEVLRFVRQTPHLCQVKVVAVTARPHMVKEASQYGLDEVIYKPLRINKLLATIQGIL